MRGRGWIGVHVGNPTAVNGFTGELRASVNVCDGPIGIGIEASGNV